MSTRRPVEPPYTGRATAAMPRSPAERLEPTRPLSRPSRGGRRPPRFMHEPGRSSGFFRILSGVFTVLVVCMALVGGGALVLHGWVNAPGPLQTAKPITIPRGVSVHEIAARLEREGAITDRWLFIAGYHMVRLTGGRPRSVHLRAGEYQIPRGASIRAIVETLSEGRGTDIRVTIPEGLTSYQIVERLKANPFLTGEIAEVPEEGSLLPETYYVPRGATRQSVIELMRAEARKVADELWARRHKDLPIKTWEEAVVLASIVEKETGRNDERELVAAVFVNRLKLKMRLQSDPTIRYGIDGGKTDWGQPILKSERAQKNRHNTYQIAGLPATPICNPGRAAIAAVLNPPSTKALYFVATGKGGHLFSETLEEHNANVKKWRVIEREIREKEREAEKKKQAEAERDAKPEKDAKLETDAKPPGKDSKATPPAPSAAPVPAPTKGLEGKGAAATKAGAPQEGTWTSTTEPAQSKAKR